MLLNECSFKTAKHTCQVNMKGRNCFTEIVQLRYYNTTKKLRNHCLLFYCLCEYSVVKSFLFFSLKRYKSFKNVCYYRIKQTNLIYVLYNTTTCLQDYRESLTCCNTFIKSFTPSLKINAERILSVRLLKKLRQKCRNNTTN